MRMLWHTLPHSQVVVPGRACRTWPSMPRATLLQDYIDADGITRQTRHDLLQMVGSLTCRGLDEDANGDVHVKTNQDYACTSLPFAEEKGSALFCVCDGHGAGGHMVSHEVRRCDQPSLSRCTCYTGRTLAVRASSVSHRA
jgi:hypothetical protein